VRKPTDFRAYAKDSLLRDADRESLGDEDEDDDAALGEADEDLEGMHPVDPSMEDAADFGDEDSRQEDNY
jgi:hypothetical protein